MPLLLVQHGNEPFTTHPAGIADGRCCRLVPHGLSQQPSSKVEVQKQRRLVRGGECDWPGGDLGITLEDAERVGHGQTHEGGGCSNGTFTGANFLF